MTCLTPNNYLHVGFIAGFIACIGVVVLYHILCNIFPRRMHEPKGMSKTDPTRDKS